MNDPDHLTRPETFTAINHARATVKRIIANGGACSICLNRKMYFDTPRCRTNPARMYPLCDKDRQQPSFELDENAKGVKGIIHG